MSTHLAKGKRNRRDFLFAYHQSHKNARPCALRAGLVLTYRKPIAPIHARPYAI